MGSNSPTRSENRKASRKHPSVRNGEAITTTGNAKAQATATAFGNEAYEGINARVLCCIYLSARRLHKKSKISFQLDEVTGVVQEMQSDDNLADDTVPSSVTAQVDRPDAAEKTEDDELATLKEQLEVEVT